ncbi:MAG: Crp/Fnr family transcriptional regulator [Desulfofustis sp.]|nr:Crp/Fnr family transcriptional regulator [Desulfofustis sp.]NNF45390.1 Crp/Fnr family transcriptional regulator [Desulfofustis sp.]NNK57436.1 Crp/Fnr family transcriptional regulator [Desulfofustis sp.]RZW20291.1 MAG: Crp/Fnr family transcriptional regulator [Desulfobulbaceae bacterium]
MKKEDIIESTALFEGLSIEEVKAVATLVYEKKFGKGETIFFEGDEANGFYLVSGGQIKVFKMNPMGKEHILHIFGPGEPVGEVPVFSGQPFPATAEAIINTITYFFPRKDFVALIEKNPSIALNMLAVLSRRLRQFATQIENLSLKEVPARLAGYLLYTAAEQGNNEVVRLPVSKGQLASLLGTIPETLSRIFAKMSEDGLIRVEGRSIIIIDHQGLRDREGSP